MAVVRQPLKKLVDSRTVSEDSWSEIASRFALMESTGLVEFKRRCQCSFDGEKRMPPP